MVRSTYLGPTLFNSYLDESGACVILLIGMLTAYSL